MIIQSRTECLVIYICNMDKYIEKMLLVPEERWNMLLKNETQNQIDHNDSPFPIENENNESNEEVSDQKLSSIDDKQLSPPGIPVEGISDIESMKYDNESDDEPVTKQNRKHKNPVSSKKTFQWKTLP